MVRAFFTMRRAHNYFWRPVTKSSQRIFRPVLSVTTVTYCAISIAPPLTHGMPLDSTAKAEQFDLFKAARNRGCTTNGFDQQQDR
jgi:hypothetical protein